MRIKNVRAVRQHIKDLNLKGICQIESIEKYFTEKIEQLKILLLYKSKQNQWIGYILYNIFC